MTAPPWNAAEPPDVVLLDLDDTIIDFGGGVGDSWRVVCEEACESLAGLEPRALQDAIDRTREWYWSDPERHRTGRADLRAAGAEIVARALSELGHDEPGVALALSNRYRDLRDASVRPIAGAVEALARLSRLGVRLGLVTNGASADQWAKIERFRLASYFAYIGVEGDVGVGKPEPGAYEAALGSLACTASRCWMVGDNLEWDVAAPQRLGIRAVWVDARRRGLPDGSPVRPDHVVAAISELVSA